MEIDLTINKKPSCEGLIIPSCAFCKAKEAKYTLNVHINSERYYMNTSICEKCALEFKEKVSNLKI